MPEGRAGGQTTQSRGQTRSQTRTGNRTGTCNSEGASAHSWYPRRPGHRHLGMEVDASRRDASRRAPAVVPGMGMGLGMGLGREDAKSKVDGRWQAPQAKHQERVTTRSSVNGRCSERGNGLQARKRRAARRAQNRPLEAARLSGGSWTGVEAVVAATRRGVDVVECLI